jgi:hypothetical protein
VGAGAGVDEGEAVTGATVWGKEVGELVAALPQAVTNPASNKHTKSIMSR